MLALVVCLYVASAVLSLVGLIGPIIKASREAGFARRAREKHQALRKDIAEVTGGPEHAAEQEIRGKALEVALKNEFEKTGRTLEWWVGSFMFDSRTSHSHAAHAAYEQSKIGLRPVAGGVLLGSIASLLSLLA